jgi:hypothetical protein
MQSAADRLGALKEMRTLDATTAEAAGREAGSTA